MYPSNWLIHPWELLSSLLGILQKLDGVAVAIESPLVPPGDLGSPTLAQSSRELLWPKSVRRLQEQQQQQLLGKLAGAASARRQAGIEKRPVPANCYQPQLTVTLLRLDFKSYPSKNIYLIHSDMIF